MKRYVRPIAVGAAVLLLVAACTTDPDKRAGSDGGSATTAAGGSATPAGPTTGLTKDAIKIAFVGADFGALAKAGIAPDLGDQPKIIQSVVDDMNARGGIDGRKIELKIKLVDGLGGPAVLQAACVEVTQDFGSFAVLIAPAVPRAVAQCTSVTQKTLTIAATGFDEPLYAQAEGRLFTAGSNTSMSTDRQFAGWAELMDREGLLKGKTIGIIGDSALPELVEATKAGLVPSLTRLGYEVAANATIPCDPTGGCTQQEAAVQKLKAAGVDFVFMASANTTGATIVTAADNLDFHPQWSANGNQVTDTVAKFFDAVKQSWDGTVGSTTLPAGVTPEATACNKAIATGSGETYEPGSDAFGQAAAICLTAQMLEKAGATLSPTALDQASMIKAIEGLGEVPLNSGSPGTLSATKHDAGNYLFACTFSAATGKFAKTKAPSLKVAE